MPRSFRRPARRGARRRPTLRLLVVNFYARNRALRAAVRVIFVLRRPHVVIGSEAHNLGEVRGYQRISGRGPRGGEVALYVRRDKTVRDARTRQVTNEGRGYVNERHVVDAVVEHAGIDWALIGLHANPGYRDPARAENVKLWDHVGDLVSEHEAAGHVPIVGGDTNRTRQDDGPDSPRGVAAELGYGLNLAGIDGIVHHPAVRVRRRRTFRVPGADHLGVAYLLEAASPATYRDRHDQL